MVIIESMVYKTIPVSTDCPTGPQEILTGNFKQFLSKATPDDLAKKIELALTANFMIPNLLTATQGLTKIQY